MFIIARSGDTYARLRFNSGPGGETELATTIDYEAEFLASDRRTWEEEFERSVHDASIICSRLIDSETFGYQDPSDEEWHDDWIRYTEDDPDKP